MISTIINKSDFQKFRIFGNKVLVHINEEEQDDKIICNELVIPCIDRNIIISFLIKANYSSDRMDAIRNNYELVRDDKAGDKTEDYTKEYNEMQSWRAYCKELATTIMNEKEK